MALLTTSQIQEIKEHMIDDESVLVKNLKLKRLNISHGVFLLMN